MPTLSSQVVVRPGHGIRLDRKLLLRVVKASVDKSAVKLESQFGISHGSATRIKRFVKENGFTKEHIDSLNCYELERLYYKRRRLKSKAKDKKVVQQVASQEITKNL